MPHWEQPILLSVLCTSLVQGGCHGPLNEQDGLLGADPPLSALEAPASSKIRGEVGQGSVVPLDRSAWALEVVVIDQGQVQAQPSYGSAEPVVGQLGQASTTWPTTHTAVNTKVDADGEALNGLLAPLVAAGNIVLFPVRCVMTPPWTVVVVAPRPETWQLLPVEQSQPPWHWVESDHDDGDD